MSYKPSLKKITTIDYTARVAIISLVGVWLLYFFLIYLYYEGPQRYEGVDVYATISVIALAIFGWRVWLIRRAFSSGLEVTGKVSHIFFYRNTAMLRTSYTYQGQRYESRTRILPNPQSMALKQDQLVVLVLHPKLPEQAFVRDLFL